MGSEPLNSPMSRAYFSPKTERIIHCAMGLKHEIDVEVLKKAFSDSIMLKHPTFCSLMVRDVNGNIERWESVQVNIDEHIIVHHPNTTKTDLDVESEINAFLADISVSTPLSEKKPLWEVHVLMGLKCVVLRMNHGLGDASSLMSMLNASFGENNNNNNNHNNNDHIHNNNKSKKRSWREKNVWDSIQGLWLTLVFGLRLLGGLLWVKNKQNVFSSGAHGVELWPRKLVTVKFKLQDFKRIRNVIPYATINDVLLGAISCGLSKYLETKSPSKGTPQGLDVTAIVTVNLRKDAGLQKMSDLMGTTKVNSSSFGNKTGSVLVSMTSCSNGLHPLEHVKLMKAIMDQKKKSYEAYLAYISQKLFSCFSPKVANWCTYRVLRNTTFLISNIVGPSKGIVIGDNPVTFLRVNGSGSPHVMTMPFVSYKGNADLQVMVARDIIHDPEFLANCIQGSFNEMIEGLHQ